MVTDTTTIIAELLHIPGTFSIIPRSIFKQLNDPDLKLSEYCKESHTNYRGVIDWTKRHGISILELRREARGETSGSTSAPQSDGAFIQFMPSSRSTFGNLRGISITFPDGVNLTLQESSVESVISLLTVYRSRLGGASSCSD